MKARSLPIRGSPNLWSVPKGRSNKTILVSVSAQLEYDDVLNNQRNVIYARRKHALLGDQLRTDLLGMLEALVEEWVAEYVEMGDYQGLHNAILRNLTVDVSFDEEKWRSMNEESLVDVIVGRALEVYKRK